MLKIVTDFQPQAINKKIKYYIVAKSMQHIPKTFM